MNFAKVLIISIALTGWSLQVKADASLPSLLEEWDKLNEKCRGGAGDEAKTVAGCRKREVVAEKIKKRGCRYQMGDTWRCE